VKIKLLPLIAILLFAAAPVVIGSAEQSKKDDASAAAKTDGKTADGKTDAKADSKTDAKSGDEKGAKTADADQDATSDEKPAKKLSSECIASEEVIADLEGREKKLKQREEALKERETEVAAEAASVKEEVSKMESKRAEIQGEHAKEMAAREEQVNKLIETFESMSPKAAAAVIADVDDELAVMALGKLTSVKAGKILGNLKADKSAHLSEMMAYGKKSSGKEASHGESNRAPASSSSKQ
jgi:flagellar motility protein MotE (MotC chaperone)